MKEGLISPSMMCVPYDRFSETLRIFEKDGISYLHIDVMDGDFVPNFALGTDFCSYLRKCTKIPLDIHLMISRPDLRLDWFDIRPGDYVSVHWESTPHVPRVLAAIREKGAKAMLALNPATPTEVLRHVLDYVDGVLLMTVNPGFAGQKMVSSSLDKIRMTRAFLDDKGYPDTDIEVDGNVSFDNAGLMRKNGANIFVGGSSGVFFKGRDIHENIMRLKESII